MSVVLEIAETPYEDCLEACYGLDESQELPCIENCNLLVKDIVFDITDSFDNFEWENLCD